MTKNKRSSIVKQFGSSNDGSRRQFGTSNNNTIPSRGILSRKSVRGGMNIRMLMPGGGDGGGRDNDKDDYDYDDDDNNNGMMNNNKYNEETSVASASSSTFFTEQQQQDTLTQQLSKNKHHTTSNGNGKGNTTTNGNSRRSTMPGTTISVVAPATLEEGYCFDVVVDEKPYTVTVPLGGVFEGEQFDVSYHPSTYHGHHDENNNNNNNNSKRDSYNYDNNNKSKMHNINTVEDEDDDDDDYDTDEMKITTTESFQTTEPGRVSERERSRRGRDYDTTKIVENNCSNTIGIVRQMKDKLERQSLENSIKRLSDHDQQSTHHHGSTVVTFKDTSQRSQMSNNNNHNDHGDHDDETKPTYNNSKYSQRQKLGQVPTKTNSSDDDDDDDLSIANQTSMTSAPTYGHWRHGLCDCCDVITQATFWMSIFCMPVLVAQLLSRMHLSCSGRRPVLDGRHYVTQNDVDTEISLTYNKVLFSFITMLIICNLLPVFGLLLIGTLYFLILLMYIGKNLRTSMRRQYQIPAQPISSYLCFCYKTRQSKQTKNVRKKKCSTSSDKATKSNSTTDEEQGDGQQHYEEGKGTCEDCLCMVCCGCCSMIQMARHTHNDKEYPGYCCTTTGLELGAPTVV